MQYRQPNSNDCFVCGMKNPFGLKLSFYDNGEDEVRCEYTISDKYQGFPDIAHGGIVAAILDEAAWRTILIGNQFRLMMTGKMELKYRLPVPLNTPLTIIGRPTKDRGRVAQAIGEIRLPDGSLAVEATLTLVGMPEHYEISDDVLDRLGWQVYE